MHKSAYSKKLMWALALIAMTSTVHGQSLGYVDPEPILQQAEAAIGANRLKCVTIAGTGYTAAVGQARHNGYEVDWPRGADLSNYQRVMDWPNAAMLERFERTPGQNPAAWKYGSGWRSGTPLQAQLKQEFGVVGDQAWHRDGPDAPAQAARSEDAEVWQLDLWMNPHGFLKAARLPGANPVATWRWELGEMGRDGPTTQPEKVWIVAINFGPYRIDATINPRYLVQRIYTRIGDPVLGDFNYEHEFSDSTYIDIGDGIRFPTIWHHHQGWDDNYQAQSINAGHNAFAANLPDITANRCPTIDLPPKRTPAADDAHVIVDTLAPGVWRMGGGSHHSVVLEFDTFIAVIEAPLNETRSLAVIEAITDKVPDKPIRFLINTHQHHDHIGGIRTYMHIGATIITHWKNYEFYTRDVLNYAPRTLDPDMLALWPPTELAEGYQYETVRENYWLRDADDRALHLSYVHPLKLVEGMLLGYLPEEKMLIQAELFNAETNSDVASARQLRAHVERLGLDVTRLIPLHGPELSWNAFIGWLDNQPAED